jgi:DNA invertase Pin-like site-specific DNA recombinase
MPTTPLPAAIWLRVSTDEQDSANQIAAVERFCAAHNLEIVKRYQLDDSAWNGGKDGGVYQRTLKQALDDAWRGEFKAIVIWALDRITRAGAEDTLRLVRVFDERGATLLSVEEPWLNTTSEVKDVLVAFAGWVAQQESRRRSQRVKASVEKRRAAGEHVGRPKGARDKRTRSKLGYHQQWAPGGKRRVAS